MTHWNIRIAHAVLAALIGFGTPLAAAQAEEQEHGTVHEDAHAHHQNFMGIFIGTTQEGREEDLTLGLEYERRINQSFGVGAFVEHTTGNLDIWVFGVPFAYHSDRWKFFIAPGLEDGHHGTESLIRIGGEYAFEAGSWEISPQINLDFVDNEEVWVLGVVIGKGF